MSYALTASLLAESIGELAKSTGKTARARRDLAAYSTYLDAADALAGLLDAKEITPRSRPAIDKKHSLWWITLEDRA